MKACRLSGGLFLYPEFSSPPLYFKQKTLMTILDLIKAGFDALITYIIGLYLFKDKMFLLACEKIKDSIC